MAEKMPEIKRWQKKIKEKVQNKTNWFINITEKTLEDNRQKKVLGMIECIQIIGRNLTHAATLYNEKFERDWDVFSTMMCLQYPDYAKAHINKKFQDEYLAANAFITKYNVFIPRYYVLCMDIYKTADGRRHNQDENRHNYARIAEILAEIPKIYRLILLGNSLEPTKKRLDKQGCISFILNVPFDKFIPTFVKVKKSYGYYDNYILNDGEQTLVCHPMHEVMVPCTKLYARTDIDLYVESAYIKTEFEQIKQQLGVYEDGIASTDAKKYAYENIIKEINIPDRETLLEKLGNPSSKLIELLNTIFKDRGDKAKKETRRKLVQNGFSRKTFYDLYNFYKSEHNKIRPEKDTIIAFAFCMELRLDDVINLLISAGYVLSPAMERDIIIKHFLMNECYSLEDLNILLERVGLTAIKGKSKGKGKECNLSSDKSAFS